MALFKIQYTDTETQSVCTVFQDFEDSPNAEVTDSTGKVLYRVNITAKEWAEDYAYSLADKGSYTVEVVK